MADEIQKIKVSELPTASSLANLAILGVDLSTNSSVKALMSLLKGLDGKSVEIQNNGTHLQWRQTGGTWADLVAVADLKGATGSNIELQKTSTHLQWRVVGGAWANLVVLEDLKVKGDTGANIEMQVTATYVQWRVVGSSTWSNLIAISDLKGGKGADAKQVEFNKSATHLQWRLVGDAAWTNLVPLSDLKGGQGDNIELQKTSTHLQWRVVGGTWANLVSLADLKGETGATPTISIGTVTTIAAGGQSSAEMVSDGVDENGVKKYKLNLTLVQGATGEVENIDTATIVFTEAATRVNVGSGDTIAAMFGKIKKWFSDLGSLAFKSSVAKSDLASGVQTSLGKADTALQSFTESDPTVPAWAKSENKPGYDYDEIGGTKPPSNANYYEHPTTHAPSIIAQNENNRFVTDAEKTAWNAKQSALNRTVGSNDNSTGTVSDSGGNLSIPISVTPAAPSESNTQTTAGTRSLRAQLKILIDNIAHLFANKQDNIAAGTASQYYRGDKTWQTLNASAVSLGNANNTSDADKPVSTAQQNALNAKLDSAKLQVVSSLPSSPNADTYYFIPE